MEMALAILIIGCIGLILATIFFAKVIRFAKEIYYLDEKGVGKMKVKLDTGAVMPTKAHTTDAGWDLYAREDKVIPARASATFDTGVHIELPFRTVGLLKSKSGLNVKHGITSEGVIDVGYTGSIVAKLYNNSFNDYRVKKGDKITQLVIVPLAFVDTLELADELEEAERGNNGFGSSGR